MRHPFIQYPHLGSLESRRGLFFALSLFIMKTFLKTSVFWTLSFACTLVYAVDTCMTQLSIEQAHYIHLKNITEPNPSRTILVKEDFTVVNKGRSFRNNLATINLYSCAAIILYDPETRVGLMSHLGLSYIKGSGSHYVQFLKSEFKKAGGNLGRSKLTVVWGFHSRRENSASLSSVISELADSKISSIEVDSTMGKDLRAADLDLDTGAVTVFSPTKSWEANPSLDLLPNKPNDY